jgi:hypothetical protein
MSYSADAGSAIMEVQAAFYRELTNSFFVPERVNAVYDYVPTNAPVPYLVFGEWTETAQNTTQSSWGRNLTLTMHVWTRGESKSRCAEIANLLIKLLEARELLGMADGWAWEGTWLEMHQILRDPSIVPTWHGVIRWRIRVRKQQ